MIRYCPKCGHEMIAESIGWKCRDCCGFVDMQGNFHEHKEKPFMPPKTNADRIRAMSDEELYKFLCSLADCSKCKFGIGVVCTLKKWLKQPSEDK